MDRLIERKQMSTKTTFKRVALVAVAALGFGMLSVVPSSAVTAPGTVTPYYVSVAGSASLIMDGTDAAATETATQIAGPVNYVALTAGSSLAAAGTAVVTVTGSTLSVPTPGGTTWTTNTAATQTVSAANTVTGSIINVLTPAAGTITVTVARRTGPVSGVYTDTTIQTFTITVSTTSASAAFSATGSTSVISLGTTYAPAVALTDDVVAVAKNTAQVANIKVSLLNGLGSAYAGTDATATVTSGPALIAYSATGTGTGNAKAAAITLTAGVGYVAINGDGTAGNAVITITVGTTVLATEKVTFYGSLAKLTATVKTSLQGDTVAAQSTSLLIVGYDAAGNVVPSQGLTVTSSDTTKLASYTPTSAALATSTAAQGPTSIAGKYGAVTLAIKDTLTGLVTTSATVTVASAVSKTTKIAFDATDYVPGAAMKFTVSAVDANGLAVADGTVVSSLFTAVPTANTSLINFPTVWTATTTGGAYTYTVYPLVSGPVAISATDSDAAAALSATATVTGDTAAADAAAEATDAANAATDAANAAAEAADAATAAAQDAADAVAALSAQVATLIGALKAQLTALTNLVIKIQKKVKA